MTDTSDRPSPQQVTPEQYQAAFRAAVEAFERAQAERESAKAVLDAFTQEDNHA